MSVRIHIGSLIASLAVALLAGGRAESAPFAYVPAGDARVHVIDIATRSVVANPQVATGMFAVAASRNTGRVYIGSQTSAMVQVMDAADHRVVDSLNLGARVFGMAVNSAGDRLYATLRDSPVLRVYDIPGRSIVANIAVGAAPNGVAVSPDGSRVVVANPNSFSVSVIDTATNTVVWTLPTPGKNPQAVAFGPGNDRAFVTTVAVAGSELVVMDLAARTAGTVPVGATPVAVAVSPDGSRIYTANSRGHSVSVIDGNTFAPITNIDLGTGASPYGISSSLDGSSVYVVLFGTSRVAVIDPSNNTVATSIPIGGQAFSFGVFTTGDTVPAAPVLDQATSGVREITLAFTPPANDGGEPITGYLARCGDVSVNATASPVTLTGLVNGASYACTVRATNSIGTSSASNARNAVAGLPPGPPVSAAAVPGDRRITLSFDPPAFTGDLPITQYIGRCNDVTVNASATPIVFTGLVNGTSYMCDVRASNAVGTGAASGTAAATPRTVPAAPQIESSVVGDRRITLTASIPAANGAPITIYTARCSGGLEAGVAAPNRTVEFNGLTNGQTYTCTMTATNEAGESAPSASIDLVPFGPPDPPVLIAATPGDASITLQFTPPPNTNGRPITGYVADCGGILRTITGSPYVFDGLVNGTPYSCSVRARNAGGDSTSSNPLGATPRTVPGAPTALAATPGDGTASIAFAPPASDGGAPIGNYTVRCTPAGIRTSTTSPVVLSGLTNNIVYRCRVSATNIVGEGPASAAVSVIPGTGSVADLRITKTNGTGFVGGGDRVGYVVEVFNLGPAAVADARVQDAFAMGFSDVQWACAMTAGARCTPVGLGDLDESVDLPAGSSVRFDLDALLATVPEDPVVNTASVSVPAPLTDPVPANNIATDGPDIRGIFRDSFE